jgi:hypothetical protein
MDYKTAVVVSCWFSIAIIASVYMFVFSDSVGDVLFGVFLPVGLLVAVALVVTIYVTSSTK